MTIEMTDSFDIEDENLIEFLYEQGFCKKNLTIKQAKEKVKQLILSDKITMEDLANSNFVGVRDDYEYNFFD